MAVTTGVTMTVVPNELNKDRLNELFTYDPITGDLRWAVRIRGIRMGDVAGCNWKGPSGQSYVKVRVDGVLVNAHRVVWAMHHGDPGLMEIDHRDGNGLNNRLSNLKPGPHAKNMQNQARIGVTWDRTRQQFRAEIKINGKKTYVGRYPTRELAEAAALAEKVRQQSNINLVRLGTDEASVLAADPGKPARPCRPGVNKDKHGKWVASYFIDYKKYHVGRFDTEQEAFDAREKAKATHGTRCNAQ